MGLIGADAFIRYPDSGKYVFILIFPEKVFPEIFDSSKKYNFEARQIISYSWPLAFVGFFNIIILQINTIMLGYYWTPLQVGIFGATQRTALIIQIILTSFNTIFTPIIADLYNRGENKKLENLNKVVTGWIIIVSMPVFILSIFFPKEILEIWGPGYTEGRISLVIISTAMIINCEFGPVRYILMMTGRTRIILINDFTAFILAITLNILLIPKYGVLMLAISYASTIALLNIVGLIEVYLFLNMHPYKRAL